MEVNMTDEKRDNDRSIRISYPASNDYQTIYVNGAYGGITPDGTELTFDLYREYSQPIEYEIRQIHGIRIGDPISKQSQVPEIVRERLVGIVMSLDKAEILANWMLNKINKFKEERDRILKEMEDEGNEQAIQSKQLELGSTE